MEEKKTGSISEKIAAFSLGLRYEDIPASVISYGKLLLKDTFGVAMASQKQDHIHAIGKTIEEMGGTPQATLWGTQEQANLANAVLYNAALIHGADYDDTHVGAIVHPSASVVSTAITVGEMVHADGRQILTAIVAGWEIIVRLGLAAKGRFHDVGFHGTGIVAPFAAACVAAKLLGDSERTLKNALGICGSQAAALQEFLRDGSWVKKIHPGWGAHSAIYALGMARNGFIGPDKVFEGEFGLYMTHCGGTDGLEEAFSDLGRVWHTTEITTKLYPVCHMTHSFIDCMIRLEEEHHFGADDIASAQCRIESRCYPIVCTPREVKTIPNTDYIMRFSLPYVVAMAAAKQKVGPAEIDLKYAEDTKMQALMDKIQCVEDDSKRNPGFFPGYLTVTLNDGRTFTADQCYEMGTPQNPLSVEAVDKKCRANLEAFYTDAQIAQILQQISGFETLKDVNCLLASLIAGGK